MKKISSLIIFIAIFSGCGKYEPKLPKKYDDVSFDQLMNILDNYKKNDNTYSSAWFSSDNQPDINKYIKEPFKSICHRQEGKIEHLDSLQYQKDFLSRLYIDHPKYLHNLETRKTPTNFTYCKKNNEVLFGYLEFKFSRKLRDYKSESAIPKYFWHKRYTYLFDKSSSLTQEVNTYVEKKNQELEKYNKNSQRVHEEYEKKELRDKEYKLKIQKLNNLKIERPIELKYEHTDTTTFKIIDHFKYKSNDTVFRTSIGNINIPNIAYYNTCKKVCNNYSHNLNEIIDGKPTLIKKEPFVKTIKTQTKYGKYYFDVTCTCEGFSYTIKEKTNTKD